LRFLLDLRCFASPYFDHDALHVLYATGFNYAQRSLAGV